MTPRAQPDLQARLYGPVSAVFHFSAGICATHAAQAWARGQVDLGDWFALTATGFVVLAAVWRRVA